MAQVENTPVTSGHLSGREHVFPVRVYYEDTDFTGVVYHARYLHFFERGRTEWLRTIGVSHTDLGEGRFGEELVFAIRRLAVDYKQPAKVDDILQVRTILSQFKGARWLLKQEMTRLGDGASIALGEVEVLLMNRDGVPRRVPTELLAIIEGR
ncbi:MAG: YbgC/FadM family acyl-CoA thioesterase [Pseudomonadota bacterium]